MIQTRARRRSRDRGLTIPALALLLAAGLPQAGLAAQPKESTPALDYEPAESLEGNFLSAYIAGAARDTTAAATYYREAVKADPRNAELVERAFISLLADGAWELPVLRELWSSRLPKVQSVIQQACSSSATTGA